MFSNELDRVQFPLLSRARGVLLGSIILVAATAGLVSARTLTITLPVAFVAFLLDAWWSGGLGEAVPRRGPVWNHVAAFLTYALVSTAWAYDPSTSFPSVALACAVALVAIVLTQLISNVPRHNLLHMGEGLWIGLLFGLVYLLIEVVTGQAIKIAIYNALALGPDDLPHPDYYGWAGTTLVSISREDLTRNMAPAALFVWPAILAMTGTLARPRGAIVGALTLLLAAVVIFLCNHETSKLAIVVGVAAFALASISARTTGRLITIAWVFVCLAVLPLALILHRFDVHEASWLQYTARHRIVIWNHTAERVLESPWFGTGARTTYQVGPLNEKTGKAMQDGTFYRSLSAHSHSVFLQTWFELGLIGASLLTLMGLAVLQRIRSFATPLQPFAYATFATAAAMAASSYGMWQTWFVSMFGFTAVAFGLGMVLHARRDHRP
jgi:O-antigen ligase